MRKISRRKCARTFNLKVVRLIRIRIAIICRAIHVIGIRILGGKTIRIEKELVFDKIIFEDSLAY